MRPSFLDPYRERDSVLHRLDARIKIAAAAAVVLTLNALRTPPWYVGAAAAALLVAAVGASRLPFGSVFRRAAAVLPFAAALGITLPFTTEGEALWRFDFGGHALVISDAGLRLYATLIAKAYLSLAYVALVLATAPFRVLLKGLAWFRLPAFFLVLLTFTYRYIYVFGEEVERLQRAGAARYFGRRRLRQFLALGPVVGALFVRSYERAERVWAAMLSRGYDVYDDSG